MFVCPYVHISRENLKNGWMDLKKNIFAVCSYILLLVMVRWSSISHKAKLPKNTEKPKNGVFVILNGFFHKSVKRWIITCALLIVRVSSFSVFAGLLKKRSRAKRSRAKRSVEMHSGAKWSKAEQSRKHSEHLDCQSLSTVNDFIAQCIANKHAGKCTFKSSIWNHHINLFFSQSRSIKKVVKSPRIRGQIRCAVNVYKRCHVVF